jgi:hypothetical protein
MQYGDLPVVGHVVVDGFVDVEFEFDAELEIKSDTVKIQLSGYNVADFFEFSDEEDWDLEYCTGCDQYKDRGEFRSALCIECDN